VALVEGKARFDDALNPAPSQQTVLTPGDIITATADSVSLKRKTNQDLSNQLGWRRGMLVFEHATLADVANEYNRYNRTKLVIEGAQTQALTISGTLPATDLGAFARLATKFFNLRVEQREGEIVVSR
jgi:transmembrane sensor